MKPYYLDLLPEHSHQCLKTATLVCERCGKPFTVPFWMVKKGRRFCSRACRKQDPLQTLMRNMEKQPNGCWNWTRCKSKFTGYGYIKVGKTSWLPHRLMWVLWNRKPIPNGKVIRHTCIGNRVCINPDHLILGTQLENIHDCIRQGRFRIAIGTERSLSSLSEKQVAEIRKLRPRGLKHGETEYTYPKLAGMFSVTPGIIWQVVNFKTYKGRLEIKTV